MLEVIPKEGNNISYILHVVSKKIMQFIHYND